MKFKLDENLPPELVDDLLALSHDADTVVEEGHLPTLLGIELAGHLFVVSEQGTRKR